jgi:hypothetical protein
MPDTFLITIIFIVLCTVIGAFISGRSKDNCLKSFSGSPVVLAENDGKLVWGTLRVENSALELIYGKPHVDEEGHLETSYIRYKNEYENIKMIVRYTDDLDPRQAAARKKKLKKVCHPGICSRLARHTRNFFGTVRDSLLEVVDLLIGRMKTATPAGSMLKGQEKYTSSLQKQIITSSGTSYEPVLERYLGKRIVLSVMYGEKKKEYSGILKEYTPEFIEIYGSQCRDGRTDQVREADMVTSRATGIVRHAGEQGDAK